MGTLMLFGHAVNYSRTGQLVELAHKRHSVEPVVIAPEAKVSWTRKQTSVLSELVRYRLSNWGTVDQIYVGFYGYFLIFLAKWLYPTTPIYFDAYISNYEIMRDEPGKWDLLGSGVGKLMANFMKWDRARLLYVVDYVALRLAKHIFIDTKTHKDYLVDTFGLSEDRVEVLYILPDLSNFQPKGLEPDDDKFRVFFHGSNQVIHNCDLIVEAAKLLEDIPDLEVVIAGPFDEYIERHAPTPNINHYPWIPHVEIPTYIDRAQLCLGGHFTPIPRAGRVIPGKTWQYLAMATPTIAQDNAANRELLTEEIIDFNKDNLILRDIQTAQNLADAIREVYERHG